MTASILLAVFVALFGLAVGSFLNVCAYRIPRKESIAWPPSHCPSCRHQLGFFDLIPVVSYIFLGARCRYCRKSIHWRYPVVELATAALFLAAWLRFGASMRFLAAIVFASLAVAASSIDLELKIIPDVLTLPGMALGLLFALFPGGPSIVSAAIGLAGAAMLLFLVAIISRGGMGGGDAKLLGMIGAFVGWKGALVALMVGSLAGAVIGLILIMARLIKRRDPIPFGPFLVAGGLAVLFFWPQIAAFLSLRGGM